MKRGAKGEIQGWYEREKEKGMLKGMWGCEGKRGC